MAKLLKYADIRCIVLCYAFEHSYLENRLFISVDDICKKYRSLLNEAQVIKVGKALFEEGLISGSERRVDPAPSPSAWRSQYPTLIDHYDPRKISLTERGVEQVQDYMDKKSPFVKLFPKMSTVEVLDFSDVDDPNILLDVPAPEDEQFAELPSGLVTNTVDREVIEKIDVFNEQFRNNNEYAEEFPEDRERQLLNLEFGRKMLDLPIFNIDIFRQVIFYTILEILKKMKSILISNLAKEILDHLRSFVVGNA